jgi:N-acetylglutamate synthase-like GNAT family acetyltransferase
VSRAWEIRDARPSDVPALEALQVRASMVWEEYRGLLTAHPEATRVPEEAVREKRVRVATAHGSTLGFSLVLPVDSERQCELDGLFVDPPSMRRGIGRALLEDAIERARTSGAARLVLVANPHAAPFYERLGFEANGVAETTFGPAPWMQLSLEAAR